MSPTRSAVHLEGSHGEGGGGLLRAALAMAALTQQGARITDVRGNTKFPGLNSEDISLIRPLARCCGAELEGCELRSSELAFMPTQRVRGLNEIVDVYDAPEGPGLASALVVANTLAPVLARSGMFSALVVQGETFGHHVLSFDYYANVTVQAFRRMGLYLYPELNLAGWGRGSRGEVKLEVEPSMLAGLNFAERGPLVAVKAVVTTSDVGNNVGERGMAHLERLAHNAGLDVQCLWVEAPSKGAGAFVTAWAEYENGLGGAAAMGIKGVRIEAIAQQAFDGLGRFMASGATVDAFLADQILPALAMADGDSVFTVDRLTERFLTTAWAIKQFLPIRLTIKGQEGGPGVVTIRK
ncbi:MAG: hypothetical protein HZC36_01065 [Armatimonadetes bacterium]|nr:hypothetical protein [Armatimonadota bacterium]